MDSILSFITENWIVSYLILTTVIAVIAFILDDKTDEVFGGKVGFLTSVVVIPLVFPFIVAFGIIAIIIGIIFLIITVVSIVIGLLNELFYKIIKGAS